MTPEMKLQSNLKEMLDQRRLSMREFANRIDYRFESVRQLCRNELLRIPVELIERTCTELDCTISDLFTVNKGGETDGE